MPDATAMAVRDGVVAWLGSDNVGRAQFPDAEVIDLAGAFVAPAFVDSHVHITATGLVLTGLDLRQATSLRHCLDLLSAYARSHPEGTIWAHGWDESSWPE
ncbi:MAG: amidohydrolase family protein, partial [Mycobacterium sp.]